MKIFNLGLEIDPGKHKYKLEWAEKLIKKFEPQKVSLYSVEFVDSEPEIADAIMFDQSKKLDLIVIDLEKIEKRLLKVEDESEKAALINAQNFLEEEKLLCDGDFTSSEIETFKLLQLVTSKPCLEVNEVGDINQLIEKLIGKAEVLLFFTAGKKEVHVWNVDKGESILEAAGKIHSDLKRGFIKAEITNCKDLDSFFNMAEARSRGLVKIVDRDYIVEEGDIVDIRFNV
ncbi:MAG: DUF933 domain-containing protein [Candidatus Omnitrophica bacterium]|nr:DUF933 domain-containing protein [Candidatus Omnitrophota bacterium]